MEDTIIDTSSTQVKAATNHHVDPLAHQIISQGAEGRIYLGDIFGMQCVVKERFPKKYRVKELDDKLTKQRIT